MFKDISMRLMVAAKRRSESIQERLMENNFSITMTSQTESKRNNAKDDSAIYQRQEEVHVIDNRK